MNLNDMTNKLMSEPGMAEKYEADKKAAGELAEKWLQDNSIEHLFPMALGMALAAWVKKESSQHRASPHLQALLVGQLVGQFFRAVCADLPALEINGEPAEVMAKLFSVVGCTDGYEVQVKAATTLIAVSIATIAERKGISVQEAARSIGAEVIDTEMLH